jgi:plasmid stabilization system protein ParE
VWPVRFTEAARLELVDAQDWYEAEAPGLGRRFRAEIDSVVRRIADNPRPGSLHNISQRVLLKLPSEPSARPLTLPSPTAYPPGRCPTAPLGASASVAG